VTVVCPLADTYISAAARNAEAPADLAASRREVKYAGFGRYNPIAIANCFQTLAGSWLTFREKNREISYLFQKCPVLVQRLNTVA